MMEGWATDSKPAQFEVAAQELSAKYHSGIQSVGHSQTGQGSVSLQVLLTAQGIHFCKCAIVATRPCCVDCTVLQEHARRGEFLLEGLCMLSARVFSPFQSSSICCATRPAVASLFAVW